MTLRSPRPLAAVLRIVLLLLLSILPATFAAAEIRLADYDSRLPAGLLDADEQAVLQAALRARPSPDREAEHINAEILRLRAAAGPGQPIRLADFRAYVAPQTCVRERPFTLGSRVIDTEQFGCLGLDAGEPASFSFQDDRTSGQTSVSIAAGLAIALTQGDVSQDGLGFSELRLTQVPLSIFVQANGTIGSSPADDSGLIRSGLKLDMMFEGGPVDRLVMTSALYYQTDMRLNQTGHGLQASLTAQRASWSIGAARNPRIFGETGGYFYVVPRATVDIFRGAGGAGLLDRNWVGSNLAVTYRNDTMGPYGILASASAQRHFDLRTRQGASLGELRFDLFTNPARTSSLLVKYRRGRLYETGGDVNEVTAGLGVRF